MKYFISMLFCFLGVIFFGCSNKEYVKRSHVSSEGFLMAGWKITDQAKNILSNSLKKSIQENGVYKSLNMCRLDSSDLIKAIEKENNCTIMRISDRNRNPMNTLKSPDDYLVWKQFKKSRDYYMEKDTVTVNHQNKIVYYKSINISEESCLNCHGSYINQSSQLTRVLNDKYPHDRAKNYSLKDLRGMWKVTFK